MANEFKIRKGLIVEGATGGTVVDVQGSLGQLFSVTDNLTGEIFAVADISGVPIMSINSSSATVFTGLVSGITPVAAANFVTKAYVDGSGGGTGPFLPLAGGTMTGATLHGDNVLSRYGTGNDFSIYHSGTDGYLQNETGNLIIPNGNVGIGLTNPTKQLHLKRTTGDVRGIMVETTVTTSYAEIQVKAASEFRIGTGGSGTIPNGQFYVYDATAGAHRFDIDAVGNVGIGTTSPGAKLHIASSTNADGILLTGDGSGSGMGTGQGRSIDFQYTAADSSFGSALRFNIPNDTVHGGALTFHTDDTNGNLQQAMLINQAQNVGIGSTSPAEKLHLYKAGNNTPLLVETNDHSGIKIKGGNSHDRYVSFQQVNGSVGGKIGWDHSAQVLKLNAVDSFASTHLVVDVNGNVGIGTNSPLAKLDIQGTQGQLFSVTDDLSGEIFAVADISGVPIMTINSSGASAFTGLVSGITPVAAANFVTKAYVDGSGGGTGGPYLPVNNPTFTGVLTGPSADLEFIKLTAANPGILMKETDVTDKNWDIQLNGGNLKFYEVNDARSVFSEKVTFEAGGNVGIGTTNPVTKLQVNGTTSIIDPAAELWLGDSLSGGDGGFIKWNSTSDYLYIGNSYNAAYNTNIVISNNGNVGIGTPVPAAKLDVEDGHIRNTNNSSADFIDIFCDGDVTGSSIISSSNNDIIIRPSLGELGIKANAFGNTGGHGLLKIYNGANAVQVQLNSSGDSYLNGGNVGINITNPSEKLHVVGNIFVTLKFGNLTTGSKGIQFETPTTAMQTCRFDSDALRFFAGGSNTTRFTITESAGSTFVNTVTATNFILSSDERLKENIKTLEPKVISAEWKSFNTKDDDSYRTGVIAQELEVKHPEFVETNEEGFKSVKYIDLLISKISELEHRIKQLEK